MEEQALIKGLVFDIQGLSVHDGPGCRTVIFLKSCSLRCSWCSNPEGISPCIEPLYDSQKCNLDGKCVSVCEQGALQIKGSELIMERAICHECERYDCIHACYTGALRKPARELGLAEVFKTIERDRKFWGAEGGITISGGEPFMQTTFAHHLLKACYDAYIHTAVETCGNVPWGHYEKSLDFINWIYYDLKHMDTNKHFSETGAHNELILNNARKLASVFPGRLVFRMPIIVGFNDDDAHIHQLIGFLKGIGKTEINILPQHNLGMEKYKQLGMEKQAAEIPDMALMRHIASLFAESEIQCYVGSDTPF